MMKQRSRSKATHDEFPRNTVTSTESHKKETITWTTEKRKPSKEQNMERRIKEEIHELR